VKNPFAMMALMAAAMTAAFKENAYRDAGIPLPGNKGRTRIAGKGNPAGSKQLYRFFKAKHGHKPGSIEQAREWYADYLAEQDAAARTREAERKARHPALKLAA
jgi:hypothetical protein